MRKRGLREDVVGKAVRELRERVRRQGRDHERVRAFEMRIGIAGRRGSRQRVEGLGGDEALDAGRRQRQHLVARADEESDELAGLVRRDATRDPEEDAGHRDIVPAPLREIQVHATRRGGATSCRRT